MAGPDLEQHENDDVLSVDRPDEVMIARREMPDAACIPAARSKRMLHLLAGLLAVAIFVVLYTSDEESSVDHADRYDSEQYHAEPAMEHTRSEPVLPPTEDIPGLVVTSETLPETAEMPTAVSESVVLPAPAEADALMREQLQAVGAGGKLAGIASGEQLLPRLVALVDGSSRGVLLRKLLPLTPPVGAFLVIQQGDSVYMDPEGYQRYDIYVDAVLALNAKAVAASFHRLRALYETAYGELGLPVNDLDNAVIRTLDRILSAPVIEEPIALARPSVMYIYADPELEALPPLQKQLLRMGPDNIRRLKSKAAELRRQLMYTID